MMRRRKFTFQFTFLCFAFLIRKRIFSLVYLGKKNKDSTRTEVKVDFFPI